MDEIRSCPYCGEPCLRDVAQVAGGLARVGPFGCMSCGAEEMTADLIDRYGITRFDPTEAKVGWLRPGRAHAQHANSD